MDDPTMSEVELAEIEASARAKWTRPDGDEPMPLSPRGVVAMAVLARFGLAIRAEVEAQQPTPEEDLFWSAEEKCKAAAHPKRICGSCTTALLRHEREVAAARELALKAERDNAQADTTHFIDQRNVANARAYAAEKALAEARAGMLALAVLSDTPSTPAPPQEAPAKGVCLWPVHGQIHHEAQPLCRNWRPVAAAPPTQPHFTDHFMPDGSSGRIYHAAPAQPVAPAPLPPEVRAALWRIEALIREAMLPGNGHRAQRYLDEALALLAPLAEEPR